MESGGSLVRSYGCSELLLASLCDTRECEMVVELVVVVQETNWLELASWLCPYLVSAAVSALRWLVSI